ncbi:aminotransferase class I/II-fold pyridoxal phosphate-dependent enzyme [Candidatus Pelagibacter sp.]|nr:aminotransferase class I/II-fold pyridoxal phosphate-dependent enzyme [Candidatus Pelagibacter sp.]
MSKISLSIPHIDNSDINYIKKTLKSGWVSTAGKDIDKFELEIKKFTKSKHVLACVNGTSGLHISLVSLGLKKTDEVIVPTITFVAPINSIRYVGASPIFFDCDKFHNLDLKKVKEFLSNNTYSIKGNTYNKKTKKKIFGIIAVHVWGNTCDLFELKKICKKYNLKLIEDASESLGSFFLHKKKRVHSGTIGDCGIISFNGNKIITTGGGGAVLCNNKKLANKIKYLINQAKEGIDFTHNEMGYNYRLPNLNAMLGISQIKKIHKYIKIKKYINKLYKDGFKNSSNVSILNSPDYSLSNNWLNVLHVKTKINIHKIREMFLKKNIDVRLIWKPNHEQKYLKQFQRFKIVNANKIIKNCILLPSSVNIKKKDVDRIISITKSIIK